VAARSGSQINIYGIDRPARDEFKRICRNLGYPMNEVFHEIIEAVVEAGNEKPLRALFLAAKEAKSARS
jgi:hypothetical protein|tara:strand:- start:16592 stop:16798 length:207 start_codon:yes stop_codon:yes gene_type:complete